MLGTFMNKGTLKKNNDVKCFFPIRAHHKSALTVAVLWGLFGSQIMFFSAMTFIFPNTYAFGIKGIDPRK